MEITIITYFILISYGEKIMRTCCKMHRKLKKNASEYKENYVKTLTKQYDILQ